MDGLERSSTSSMSSNEFMAEKPAVQPQDLLQINMEDSSFRPHITIPTHAYPPSYLELNNFSDRLQQYGSYNGSGTNSTSLERFPFFGHHFNMHHYPPPANLSTTTATSIAPTTSAPATVVRNDPVDDKNANRLLQQQIRRMNESPEQRDLRLQKNRDLNRRRRESNESPEQKELRREKNRETNRRRREFLESPEQKELRLQKNRDLNRRRREFLESPEEKELRLQKNRELNRQRRASLKETGMSTELSRNRLRQRIKRELIRINETAEEREIRLEKNREMNRRRRASLKDSGISTEQSRNRLRQRVKREISRMLRTGGIREDFLMETFADVRIFFSDDEYNSLHHRVLETIEYVRSKKVETLNHSI